MSMKQTQRRGDRVRIFDTTLRDGEQSPGNSMNGAEKLRFARQLAELNVDVIEAGFPASSQGDFDSVREIARDVQGPTICALARTHPGDIDRAAEALQDAGSARIHTFIATSDIHMQYKLRMNEDEVVAAAGEAVTRARRHVDDVEFSCEDATRSRPEFLLRVFQTAVDAGATTLNIPDTVGYTVPSEYRELVHYLREHLRGSDAVILSTHCHDDLGLAVANSVAAVEAGARQIECTVNGIGERAGNTSLEEVVMALHMRREVFGIDTQLERRQLYPTSRLLSQITGVPVQPNKAVVGANAFAHEAGIHQDGVLKNALTYEIMQPQDVGVPENRLVLGKHSGRHAFRKRLEAIGYPLAGEDFERAFKRFKTLADQKKQVFDEDIEAIVADQLVRVGMRYQLISVNVASGTEMEPTATVVMEIDGQRMRASGQGDGPVDAALNAVKRLIPTEAKMEQYVVAAISGGTDAQGEVTVRLNEDGRQVHGQGADTDIMVASTKAYLHALNKLSYRRQKMSKPELEHVSGP